MAVYMRVARRIGYRSCYILTLLTGTAAAHLASHFRTLGEAGSLAIVLQLPVLLCWLIVRPISCAAFAGCCALAPRA